MEFRVYCRADQSLVLVPSLFEIPQAAEKTGALTLVGAVTIDLSELSERTIEQLGLQGFVNASPRDATVVSERLVAAATSTVSD